MFSDKKLTRTKTIQKIYFEGYTAAEAIVLTNVYSVYVVGKSVNPLQYDGHHDAVFKLLTILVLNHE